MHDSNHSLAHKARVLIAVIVPLLGLIAGVILFWGKGIDFSSLGLFGGFSILTILGITVGYHRQFTHKSFETTETVRKILIILGSMSVQGLLEIWVADHRHHHRHSDTEKDLHSPKFGFWKSHIGWLFRKPNQEYAKYVNDLLADEKVLTVSRLFPLWVVLGLIVPALIGFIISGTFYGAFLGFLWGGIIRIGFVHHVTWSVNSVCHMFGQRHFVSKDDSRNNIIVGILAGGEGWHNGHHAFQHSAKHGLLWWQFDLSYELIKFLEDLGLAWKVKVPSEEEIERRLLHT